MLLGGPAVQPIRSQTYLIPSQWVMLKLKEHLQALPLLPIMLGDNFTVTAVLRLLLAEFLYTPRKHETQST